MKKLLSFLITGFLVISGQIASFSFAYAEEKPDFYEQIYLTETEALDLVFDDLDIEKKSITITPEQKKQIQRRLRRKVPENEITFYLGKKNNEIKRYAIILDEKGKHFPITFIVAMGEQIKVQQVAIMVYREKRGDAVNRKRFLNQFNGKSSHDALEVNVDIIHLTGATISSWSVTAGVKKAVVLVEELLLKTVEKSNEKDL